VLHFYVYFVKPLKGATFFRKESEQNTFLNNPRARHQNLLCLFCYEAPKKTFKCKYSPS